MVYYFLAFGSVDLTEADKSFIDCYKRKRWFVGKSRSTWAMAVKR